MNSKWLYAIALGLTAGGWGVFSGSVSAQEQTETKQGAMVISAQQSGDGSAPQMQVMSFSSEDGGGMFMSSMDIGADGLMLGGMGADPFQMLNSPDIQKELDLVGDQLDQYKRVQQDYGKRIKDQIDKMSKGGNFGQDSGLRDALAEIEKQKKADLDQILLPHQRDRLQQISLQSRMKGAGVTGALGSEEIREKLGLSEEDLQKMKDKAKEMQSELQAKIQKLRDEMQEELLKETLNPDQRAKLKELVGEKFDYKPQLPIPGMKVKREKEKSK